MSSFPVFRFAALTTLALLAASAYADIYKSVDADGRVTFSNIPMKGAVKVYTDPIPMGSSKVHGKSGGGSKVTAPSPADFPRVDAATQKSRDTNRRQILTDELATEQQALSDARKALADAQTSTDAQNNPQKYQERVSRLRDNATLHEKNVAALQQEMARDR
ncbi:DUF4124 domain-containing protein [Silvimonas iriomotensis]|uniref:DUF4124 domain-containing protein n=1 Tax=Silvimonas iriomotensis TaxID=449662 RepID=A0ABQ2PBJ9_9NEIS|nr:DUF4124 domain-containing protein [Silvimonas iriomotensis]GGP22600.1 hypothetical protein GCM10010970_26040 [Silvimonas iriomotensis]